MFASVNCPTCKHKYSIPEGSMGSRTVCPNCQTPFLAGKSVALSEAPMKMEKVAAQPAGINKTMLASSEPPLPPIKYNCPRCNKALESPASEAGTKKPCPACSQRLQVPAAPAPVRSGINKTMLASDSSYSQPPAASQTTQASAGQTSIVPQSMASRILMGIGLVIIALLILSFTTGPSAADREKYMTAQLELQRLKMEMEQKNALLEQQRKFEAEQKRQFDAIQEENRRRQEKLERDRELDRANQAFLNDQNLAAQQKAKREQEQREIDRLKEEAERKRKQDAAEMEAKLAKLEAEVKAAKNQTTTVIQQAPPPPVYYPWHYRYYYGW